MNDIFKENDPVQKRQGATIVLPSQVPKSERGYQDTALPFAGSNPRPAREEIPERLREMLHLFEYGRESVQTRARNFYRQAVFMADYEDDVPWRGDFERYFPTYHDLTVRQLRGYFTWRARLRRGDFSPIATSAAYIYLYELLNGIGVASPEAVLEKFQEFEKGYIDAGFGDERMRENLRRWTLDFVVLHDLPVELARERVDQEMLRQDKAVSALRAADAGAEEIFTALDYFYKNKLAKSAVLKDDPARGKRLFCAAWREAMAYEEQGQDLFTLCFGRKQTRQWSPLSNAVYYEQSQVLDRDYVLNDCRAFHGREGVWKKESYERLFFDLKRLQGFIHEADVRLRRYLKTGRYLTGNPSDAWAAPYIDAAIEADRRAVLEASRPKITIDLSGLDRIRQEALATRDSLLTGEDVAEAEAAGDTAEETMGDAVEEAVGDTAAETVGDAVEEAVGEAAGVAERDAEREAAADAAGDAVEEAATEERTATKERGTQGIAEGKQTEERTEEQVEFQVLRALLEGGDALAIIRSNRLMPSIVADTINEALYEEFGDTVILCEDDRLFLMEDYLEDLRAYMQTLPAGCLSK